MVAAYTYLQGRYRLEKGKIGILDELTRVQGLDILATGFDIGSSKNDLMPLCESQL